MSETLTTLQKTVPSYLYQEYNDDENLQAFVDAYNTMTQQYVNLFNQVNLPIYTGPVVAAGLLDVVGNGLYGVPRPALPLGFVRKIGPLNTWGPNFSVPVNTDRTIGSETSYPASDDIYRRCLTWMFFKGDGNVFSIRFLKRRVMRFLTGTNGIDPGVSQTYQVSVTFGVGNQVAIRILQGLRTVTGGALPGRFYPNELNTTPNQLNTTFQNLPTFAVAGQLQAAINAGILTLPFQFTYVVVVN